MMPVRVNVSSSTTKTELGIGKETLCTFYPFAIRRSNLTHRHQPSHLLVGKEALRATQSVHPAWDSDYAFG